MSKLSLKTMLVIMVVVVVVILGSLYYSSNSPLNNTSIEEHASLMSAPPATPTPSNKVSEDQNQFTNDDFSFATPDPVLTATEAVLTLKQIWKYSPVDSSNQPIINEEFILLQSPLSMLDTKLGTLIWKREHSPDNLVLTDNKIVFSEGREVIALDQRSGKQLWGYQIEGASYNTLTVEGNIVYVITNNGYMLELDLQTGEEKDESLLNSSQDPNNKPSSPVIAGNFLYYILEGADVLYQIDIRSGEVVWFQEEAAGNGIMDIFSNDNKIFWLNATGVLMVLDVESKMISATVMLSLNPDEYISGGFYEYNNVLYMFSNKQITGVDLNDEHTTLMFNINFLDSSENIKDIAVKNDKLFFVTNTKLYSVDLSGNDLTNYMSSFTGMQNGLNLNYIEFVSNGLLVGNNEKDIYNYVFE